MTCSGWLIPPPLPCAALRETLRRPDLAGRAGYGYCASHSAVMLCGPAWISIVR
jgi:hypothetical protein